MFGLPNTSRVTSSLANSGALVPEGVRVGNHTLDTLLQGVRAGIHPQVERTFSGWMSSMQQSPLGAFSPHNTLMLAALECASKALRDYGVNLNATDQLPENIHLLVREALKLGKQSPYLMKCMPTKSMAAFVIHKLDPEKVDFRLNDIRQLHLHGFNDKTPFADIAPEHRWRMCIDPQRMTFLERHFNHVCSNPMLPFLFDSDPGYLHGMLNAWSVSMQHLDHPLDSQLMSLLHGACEPFSATGEHGFSEPGGGFQVQIGSNMSVAGKAELLAFARRVREVVPNYGVVSKPGAHKHFMQMLAMSEDREALWKQAEPDKVGMLIRSPISGPLMKTLIDGFCRDYQTRMRDTPEHKLQHMVQLCQELERLHPFGDGNCRTFGVLLLNNLLARHDMPLTMMDDPNALDGFSLAECVAKVVEGQRCVAQWQGNRPTAVPSGAGSKTALQTRLEAEFTKR